MKTRFISGGIGAVILVIVLISDKMFLNIGVALIASIAVLEMYKAVGLSGFKSLNVLGIAVSFGFTYAQAFDGNLLMPLLFLFCAALFLLLMFHVEHICFEHIAKAFFAAIFVSFFLGHLVFIRKLANGRYLIWTVFVISFLTDTFAYLTGRFFGRHKLAPALSPKKTVEGAAGGFLGAVAGMMVFGLILEKCFLIQYNFLNAFIISVICSVISQFGDLAASAIKREYKIKDYGNIMPGHGGIMDRFDGVAFTAPAVYYLLMILPVI